MSRVLWWSHFSGGGGSTLGAIAAGLTPVLGIEFDSAIAKMYAENCGAVICKDIAAVTVPECREFVTLPSERAKTGEILVVQTSPPCQEYSAANKNKDLTSDRALILEKTLKFYAIFRPEYVILENVPAYAKSEPYLRFKQYLTDLGYNVSFEEIVNCADYGVPQTRRRLITIFNLTTVPKIKLTPSLNKENWVSWYDAIKDLIPYLRKTNLTDKQKLALNKVFNKSNYLIERVAYRNEPKIRDSRTPSWTIRAQLADDGKRGTRNDIIDIVTETDVRVLDVKCLARLQSFPDIYKFSGKNKTDVKVIGNSVPPLLMEHICGSILDSVKCKV